MNIYGADDKVLMNISSFEPQGSSLLIKGKILGSLPLSALLRPEDLRAALGMMDWKTRWFVFTLLFRGKASQS